MRLTVLLLFFISLSCVAQTSTNQVSNTSPLAPVGEFEFNLSMGFGGIENPISGAKNINTYLLPNVSYYGEKFYFDDFAMGYSLVETPNWLVDIYSTFNEDGFFFELNGLDSFFLTNIVPTGPRQPTRPNKLPLDPSQIKRNVSYLGGFATSYFFNQQAIKFSQLWDVSGVHHGFETQLSWRFDTQYEFAVVGLELGAQYKSQKLVEYYYSVRKNEQLFVIPEYTAEASLNGVIKFNLYAPLSEQWGVEVNLSKHYLGSSIKESYLVDKASYFSGFIGINYRFD